LLGNSPGSQRRDIPQPFDKMAYGRSRGLAKGGNGNRSSSSGVTPIAGIGRGAPHITKAFDSSQSQESTNSIAKLLDLKKDLEFKILDNDRVLESKEYELDRLNGTLEVLQKKIALGKLNIEKFGTQNNEFDTKRKIYEEKKNP